MYFRTWIASILLKIFRASALINIKIQQLISIYSLQKLEHYNLINEINTAIDIHILLQSQNSYIL